MFCNECGTRAREGARFCGKCGLPLQAAPSPRETEESYENHETRKGSAFSVKQQLWVGLIAFVCVQGFYLWRCVSLGDPSKTIDLVYLSVLDFIIYGVLVGSLISLWKRARPYAIAIGLGFALIASLSRGVRLLDKYQEVGHFKGEVQGTETLKAHSKARTEMTQDLKHVLADQE